MIDFHIEKRKIPLPPANDPFFDQPPLPPTPEDLLRCDIWVSCDLEYCQKHGCVNALLKNRKGVKL